MECYACDLTDCHSLYVIGHTLAVDGGLSLT
ncbi:hypothetical protein HCH_06881 [Hahella chejuensis KCTC 2396]|uniref:Uncharacterized protein n=1 Tax=Hahella chejuensis (strain KCTC 2396) TaxID=349521 RepID=Q2S774_HAHCH|nr:hypothetical protein HCH_06881 [Hahella chejuensis KCTC 2396]